MKPPPKGLHMGFILGGFVTAVVAALYPIAIHPYLHVDEYKQVQQQTRKGIDQESVQPGGMKVWSDPFGRK
uniref:Putative secreted protein n=1 Tax=Amblyomma triste TaxID=251400 RepID=A0A023G992_AMBTT